MNKTLQTLVVDSDALIALFNREDSNFKTAKALFERFYEQKVRLIYPATVLVETVDTIQRRLKKYEIAKQLVCLILSAEFAKESVESINGIYLEEGAKYFQEEKDNRKTLADAIVIAVANKNNVDGIFSFDEGYKKVGYQLASEF